MSVRRENTFRIDYANVPKKPSFEELHDFVGSTLGLSYEQVVRLQPSRALGCAFVKVVDLELARKIVAANDNKHETKVDGKAYKLRITLEDGAVEVKLTDLSEDITNEQISEFLSTYGEVLSITEQLWDEKFRFAGLPTGTRIARMIIKHNIPSYVTIDGQTTNVLYFGQLLTCRYCSEFVHNGITCVQNKKLLVQKTYASVAKQPETISADPKTGTTKKRLPFANLFGPKPSQTSRHEPPPTTSKPNTSGTSATSPKPTNTMTIVHDLKNENAAAQTANLMQPPALPTDTPSTNRVSTRPVSDGNETDNSSTSNNSKRRGRPPGKKLRQNYGNDTNAEVNTQS